MEDYSENKNEVANVEWSEDVLMTEMLGLGPDIPMPESKDSGNIVEELCYGMVLGSGNLTYYALELMFCRYAKGKLHSLTDSISIGTSSRIYLPHPRARL